LLLGVQEAYGVDQDLRFARTHLAEQGVVNLVDGLFQGFNLMLKGLKFEGVAF
jgi:hypothetical protein